VALVSPPPLLPRSNPVATAWADAQCAAALLAIDPWGLGGARLRGPADERRDHWLALLRSHLPAGTPWQRLPLHTDDERLLGGLDLAATLQTGRVVQQQGLLARSDGGFVLAAMAERMSPAMAARLSVVLDTRQVGHAAAAGAAPLHRARIAVLALDESLHDAAQPQPGALEDQPPPGLLDRLGLQLDLRRLPSPGAAAQDLRVDAIHNVKMIQTARHRLASVQCSDALMQTLCEAAAALGVDSLRAPLFALAAARAHAAWQGRREVTVEDAALAARLVLAPRATQLPPQPLAADPPPESADQAPSPDASDASDETPDTPPAPPQNAADANEPGSDESNAADSNAAEPSTDQPTADHVLQAALAALPPGLLAQLATGAQRPAAKVSASAGGGASGGRSGEWRMSKKRGRPFGSRRGDVQGGARLHLIDTLRAAAPWQALRKREARAGSEALAVHVRREDFHIKRFRQRSPSTTLFVVDASGSAALDRLAEAKGAVELLLAECYVRRDQVALLAFRGQAGHAGAELLLPPTRSLVRAKRALAALPGGGGTPLAAALEAAREVMLGIQRRGGSPLAVFLSDGRANLNRAGQAGRESAHNDALACARDWAAAGLSALWLDTGPQPQAQAQQLALTMGARYLPLPYADANKVNQAVRRAR
jgi:magnesium chelatase subunit D